MRAAEVGTIASGEAGVGALAHVAGVLVEISTKVRQHQGLRHGQAARLAERAASVFKAVVPSLHSSGPDGDRSHFSGERLGQAACLGGQT